MWVSFCLFVCCFSRRGFSVLFCDVGFFSHSMLGLGLLPRYSSTPKKYIGAHLPCGSAWALYCPPLVPLQRAQIPQGQVPPPVALDTDCLATEGRMGHTEPGLGRLREGGVVVQRFRAQFQLIVSLLTFRANVGRFYAGTLAPVCTCQLVKQWVGDGG